MAISASELPELSRSVGPDGKPSAEQARALLERLDGALSRLGFFVVPSAIACAALGDRIVGLLFQTGAFRRSDTISVWMILGGASVGLVAATRARLYSSALYALSDTRTPLKFAVVRVLFGGALGATLAFPVRQQLGLDDRFGAAALTLGSALAGWL
jgi:putative peptidoglycan lipid II flippase